ncbi:uncharacterized protein LOC131647388 [Vicia villosa]|uniref:uncharacterized protein LOC131647388 n=1 Tax=Vicia villosa TaxID=3911 RepID=UPI00273AA038|nr:uncharacterized protein LOC131647388 [Vicia villosa]
MFVIPIRWCPPTSNMELDSSSPDISDTEVDASRISPTKSGISCHQCRRKTSNIGVTCKNPRNGKPCVLKFCHKCLKNRYGEMEKDVGLLIDWKCPKCRGICNCSYCMKKIGQKPTGALSRTAKASGFESVSEMLIKKASEDLELNKINNIEVIPSNETTSEKV